MEENGRFQLKKPYYVRRYGFQEDDFELVETGEGGSAAEEAMDHSEEELQTIAAVSAQNSLDSATRAYVDEGADIISGFKKEIRKWAGDYNSIESALTDITDLEKLLKIKDGSELADSLLAAMLDGERLGSSSIKDEDFAEAEWGAGRPFKEAIDYFKAKSFKFLMTINDTPEVREIFKGFNIEETTLKYSMSTKAAARAKPRTELLILNYE